MNSLLLMKTTLPWYSGLQLLPSYIYDPWIKSISNENYPLLSHTWEMKLGKVWPHRIADLTEKTHSKINLSNWIKVLNLISILCSEPGIYYNKIRNNGPPLLFAEYILMINLLPGCNLSKSNLGTLRSVTFLNKNFSSPSHNSEKFFFINFF